MTEPSAPPRKVTAPTIAAAKALTEQVEQAVMTA